MRQFIVCLNLIPMLFSAYPSTLAEAVEIRKYFATQKGGRGMKVFVSELCRTVNSRGGRILVLVLVVLIGIGAELLKVSYAKEMVLTTLATLLTLVAGQRNADK
jgi:hypothetical protein